jgi:hypothetical protein
MAKEVTISNSSLNSYGYRILTEGIDLKQYRRNPILLWQHNRPWRGTTDEVLPIGRMENLRIEGDSLIGTPVFDENDEFAKKIKSKFESGYLKMVSAGLDVIETSDDTQYILQGQRRATVTKSKLVEVSIVDIGANDDALVLYKDGKMIELSAGGETIVPELELKYNFNKDRMDKKENNLTAIALKLGLSETATEAEIIAKIGVLQQSAQRTEELSKEIEQEREKTIELEVESAIKNKLLSADMKAHFVKIGKTSGIDALKTTLSAMSPALKPTDYLTGKGGATQEYKKLSDVPEDERIELRSNDVETYKKLYKAEYGFIPEIE